MVNFLRRSKMKKFVPFLVLCLFISIMLMGCATGSQTTIQGLTNRIDSLENTISNRDREISRLQDQINRLSREIADRDKTIAQLKPKPEPITKTDDQLGVIRVNATVEEVQKALQKAGYYDGKIDGKIGPRTISGISDFQRDHGLTTDSIVGKKTWELLQKHLR